MLNFVMYTLARLLLFLAASGLAYLLGARGYLTFLIGIVISAPASYVLLARHRDAMSAQVVSWIGELKSLGRRLEEGAGKEDVPEETASAEAPGSAPAGQGVDQSRATPSSQAGTDEAGTTTGVEAPDGSVESVEPAEPVEPVEPVESPATPDSSRSTSG
ncbi:DUF4229 domain-containing protein [Lipingzhangella sp. LS1_29]|uniref:DUF4229 domain-containing protein n=1 Tax=Lipingzhangella rawalii TaxID=2055835 RepID=A0ABU2H8W4_9ACTN|nr:DUF4229 domain-containing protein [Lipingzhangella rawalii]MDS1271737.1 DUF4229 domain-containing protein [Lipingzhangella rawalii]